MIAMVGLEKFKLKQFNKLDYPAKPRWALDEDAAFLKGAGVRLYDKIIGYSNLSPMYGPLNNKKAGIKGAPWDGVRNFRLNKNLKSMKKVINVFLSFKYWKTNCRYCRGN